MITLETAPPNHRGADLPQGSYEVEGSCSPAALSVAHREPSSRRRDKSCLVQRLHGAWPATYPVRSLGTRASRPQLTSPTGSPTRAATQYVPIRRAHRRILHRRGPDPPSEREWRIPRAPNGEYFQRGVRSRGRSWAPPRSVREQICCYGTVCVSENTSTQFAFG
jgi:hypothetical protein